jgi:hypothetical protein
MRSEIKDLVVWRIRRVGILGDPGLAKIRKAQHPDAYP